MKPCERNIKSNCTAGTENAEFGGRCAMLEKKAGGGAPCGRAEGVYIAMGIRVFGVRGSKGTSTEKGISVAFSGFSFPEPAAAVRKNRRNENWKNKE